MASRSIFKPCIDLHNGAVKQIVGASLSDDTPSMLKTNFVSEEPPAFYANLYRTHDLRGAHVIMLGPNNEQAAKEALAAWPKGLQVGGGISIDNAQHWLDCGADKVIVTSWLFPEGKLSMQRLKDLSALIGKDNLVIDVSCRKRGSQWFVAMNKWQTITDVEVCRETLVDLAQYCSEFLVHAADVEGLCQGIDEELVQKLGEWSTIPCTYAGGGKEIEDLKLVHELSNGRVDLTFGSALDIFGGSGVKFMDAVAWNKGALVL
ncbi:Phosphoribosylformimino-5-aminoimidazole carboxamide ribotide isomerase [Polychytrium aggregatum]|uniref:Phosphoribosylformimino-5-aminoimidazole carboxamide ribotide isomerase n=1 Tax=Polychytrium aggregatum TaxID=110093 RepID=UPI0022FE9773|nr:Phosphoribosylformimino-5-aminoimidazole carboxamide ribotide isomerase [Polychytrium aggregatum]KAI9207512.1 Phosphoribosylformimino-5-aminoimidazole carboxamide ribotide isomerase [Polychytrium aggregatum]